jgi:PBP1b-binding outer membrane lipoprotein LpoB
MTMSKFRWMIVLVVGIVVLSGCQSKPAAGAAVPTDAQDVPRITPQDLKSMLDAGDKVLVVDARSLASYQASHIVGAGSMPLDEIDARYKELPKGVKIVFYCT